MNQRPTADHPASRGWRSRISARTLAIAAVLLVLLVGGVVANAVLEQQYSPASAVEQYLGATETGNAAAAWAAAQVEAPAKPVDAKLLNQAALQAALAGSRANYPGLGLGSTTFGNGGGTATVGYSYRRSGRLTRLPQALSATATNADSASTPSGGWSSPRLC